MQRRLLLRQVWFTLGMHDIPLGRLSIRCMLLQQAFACIHYAMHTIICQERVWKIRWRTTCMESSSTVQGYYYRRLPDLRYQDGMSDIAAVGMLILLNTSGAVHCWAMCHAA